MNKSENIIRVKQVAERLGISAAAVWNKTNPKHRSYCPDFPKPFKVSANITGWLESEISAYIEMLAATRTGAKS